MKKIFVGICCLLFGLCGIPNNAPAQTGIKLIQFGIKAGLSTQNTNLKRHLLGENDNLYSLRTTHKVGYHVGIMSRINLAMLYIQPELLYNVNRFDLRPEGSLNGKSFNKTKVSIKTVEVPLLLGFRIAFLRLNAGPVFNLATNTTTSGTGSTLNTNFYKSNVGFQLGGGFDIRKFTFDARYNGQFKNPTQDITIGNVTQNNVKTTGNGWSFSLGYFL